MSSQPQAPRDLNQWAKRMVDLATGGSQGTDSNEGKNIAALDWTTASVFGTDASPHRAVVNVISTRRFFWRPSGLSAPFGSVLGATGLVLPKPRAAMLPDTPWATSHWRTDCARRSDRAWLY